MHLSVFFAALELRRDGTGLCWSLFVAGASLPSCSGSSVPGLFCTRWFSVYAETGDSLHANGDGKHGPAEYQWQTWILDLTVGFQTKEKPSLVQCPSLCSL